MSNLYNFIKGNIATNYTVPEEKGFLIQGNVGTLLNADDKLLNSINNGLLLNVENKTSNNDNIINYTPVDTPALYCQNYLTQSELLPNYLNGTPNTILSPNCDFKIGNKASPTLYGVSTFGINDPEVINNSCNDIGHEIETYGDANLYGVRALGQGKSALHELQSGYNVPNLYTTNIKDYYITKPETFNKDVPLYQVGDWTKTSNNFLDVFNNNQQCNN